MQTTKTVPISAINVKFQIRKKTDEKNIQKIIKSIDAEGWWSDQYLDVIQENPDRESYMLADGNHRLEALRRLGFEEVPVRVVGSSALEMHKCAYRKNSHHGKDLEFEEREDFYRFILKVYGGPGKFRWGVRKLSSEFEIDQKTLKKYRDQLECEGFVFPEMVVGIDGKEYPAKSSGAGNPAPGKPATPAIPHEYCAGGCGVPIWDDMKKAADCTYIESGGRWFCSEECARAYSSEHPEPWAPPDDGADTDPVIVGETVEIVDEDEPPARVPAPSSSQASGAETEQEEPTEFAFNDVDAETLPVYTAEPVESTSCGRWIRCYVEVEGTTDPEEALRIIKAEMPISHGKLTLKFDGLNENINIQNLNNNININHETFTEFFINCRGKKGPVKVFISRKKYEGWQRQFGPSFDIDQNIRECCDYYNELTGSEMLSAGGVYSKVYAWLLKNWKALQKQSKPKQNAYKDAGLRFDPSRY